jgi:phage terminase Nu1 subunit (DNA packaging protein)
MQVSRKVVIDAVAKEFQMPPTLIRTLFDKGLLPQTNDKLVIAKALLAYFADKERELIAKRRLVEGSPQYQANLRLTQERAERQALENAVMAKQLIHADAMLMVWSNLFSVMRQRLLGLPVKAADQVKEMKSRDEIEFALRSYVEDALNELSNIDLRTIIERDISDEYDSDGPGGAEVSSATA